jgi:predicted nucleic-acid-binding protein
LRITADTNLLLRAATQDDPAEAALAEAALREASLIAIPTPVLCEFVWVLRSAYGLSPEEVAAALRRLIEAEGVETDRAAAQAGLALLEAGGDFADGAIAEAGRAMGGEVFVTFGRGAEKRLRAAGHATRLLRRARR